MKLFSRWTQKKENLEKREEQRKIAKEKVALPKKEAEVEVVKSEELKPKQKGLAYRFLLKPLVTEKSTYLQGEGKYCFVVAPSSNKTEIKKAIEANYGVQVTKVRMMNYQGKKVRYGRIEGQRKNWKKAIVTLKKGEKIEIYKGV